MEPVKIIIADESIFVRENLLKYLAEYVDIKIIVLSAFNDKDMEHIVQLIKEGAMGYFMIDNMTPAKIVTLIRNVHEKGTFFDDELNNALHESFIRDNPLLGAEFS